MLFPIFWNQSHWKYFIEILYIEQRLNQMLEFCHLSPYSFQLNSFVRAWVGTLISRFPPNEKSSRKCVIFWTFHQSFRLLAIQYIRYSVSFCSVEETFCAWSNKVMCLVLLPTNLLHIYNANDGVSKWFHEMERALAFKRDFESNEIQSKKLSNKSKRFETHETNAAVSFSWNSIHKSSDEADLQWTAVFRIYIYRSYHEI